MTSLQQQTRRAVKWSTIDVFARQGVQFFVSVILARILAPDDFGLIAMLALFIGVATIVIDSGFNTALIQRQTITHTDESTVFFFNLGMGMVVALLLCAISPWIASFFERPALQYLTYCMAFTLFVNALGSIHNTLLVKAMDFKTMAKVGLVSSVASGAAAIGMAIHGLGVWSLAGNVLISSITTSTLLWLWHPWRPVWSFSFNSIKQLYQFSSYMMATTLIDVFATNLYLIMIGKLYSANDVGLYDRAKKTQQLPVMLMVGIVQRVALSAFSTVSEDQARLARGLRRAQAVCMFVNMPVLIGIIILAEPIVLVLFGPQWLPSVPILRVLGLGGLLWPMLVLNQNVLIAKGRSDLRFKIEVIKKTFAISLTVAASFFGVMAIAWTQVCLSVFSFLINTYFTKKLIDYDAWDQMRDLSANFVAVLLMALVIFSINAIIKDAPLIKIVSAIFFGGGTYLLASKMLHVEIFIENFKVIKAKIIGVNIKT